MHKVFVSSGERSPPIPSSEVIGMPEECVNLKAAFLRAEHGRLTSSFHLTGFELRFVRVRICNAHRSTYYYYCQLAFTFKKFLNTAVL